MWVGDLINAAALRATIAQIERYDSAVNNFRLKYNALPGDMQVSYATAFGFATGDGQVGQGDGNGLIECCVVASASAAAGEILWFWDHLSNANLIEGGFNGPYNPAWGYAQMESPPITSLHLPAAKLGRGNFITVYSYGGHNYYQITVPVPAIHNILDTAVYGMTPLESYNIDSKIDDGYPTTGRVQSMQTNFSQFTPPGPGIAMAASFKVCGNTDTTPATYNMTMAANNVVCSINLRFQ